VLAEEAKEKMQQLGTDVEGAVHDASDQALFLARRASAAAQDAETRDVILLGAAGVAVAAALTIAYQRQN
jgi:hypothetical protein